MTPDYPSREKPKEKNNLKDILKNTRQGQMFPLPLGDQFLTKNRD